MNKQVRPYFKKNQMNVEELYNAVRRPTTVEYKAMLNSTLPSVRQSALNRLLAEAVHTKANDTDIQFLLDKGAVANDRETELGVENMYLRTHLKKNCGCLLKYEIK